MLSYVALARQGSPDGRNGSDEGLETAHVDQWQCLSLAPLLHCIGVLVLRLKRWVMLRHGLCNPKASKGLITARCRRFQTGGIDHLRRPSDERMRSVVREDFRLAVSTGHDHIVAIVLRGRARARAFTPRDRVESSVAVDVRLLAGRHRLLPMKEKSPREGRARGWLTHPWSWRKAHAEARREASRGEDGPHRATDWRQAPFHVATPGVGSFGVGRRR